jgi:hypothetical protein
VVDVAVVVPEVVAVVTSQLRNPPVLYSSMTEFNADAAPSQCCVAMYFPNTHSSLKSKPAVPEYSERIEFRAAAAWSHAEPSPSAPNKESVVKHPKSCGASNGQPS